MMTISYDENFEYIGICDYYDINTMVFVLSFLASQWLSNHPIQGKY